MKATQILIDEHSGVMVILKVLEKINAKIDKSEEINSSHLDEIVEFFQVFVDQCHHSKEEVYLFPTIETIGFDADKELVKELLDEHQKGREFVKAIKEALSVYKTGDKKEIQTIKQNAKDYTSLLTEHIKKENTILFPRVDKLISKEEQDEMYEEFEEIETDVIGVGRHEEFHMMIKEMKKIYL